MTTIAELRLSGEGAACKGAFDRHPSLECEMEPSVAGDRAVWFAGVERSMIDEALAMDPTIESHEHLATEDDRVLYRIEFGGAFEALFELVSDDDGAVLTGVAREGRWTVCLWLSRREDVRDVFDRLTEHDLDVDVVRLADPLADTGPSGLTAEQHEALAVAIDRGYFETPCQISLEELADELGITHQALSERFRRAYQALATTEFEAESAATSA